MELDQTFVSRIQKLVDDAQKPVDEGHVLCYYLKWYRKFGHQNDMNRLAGVRYPSIDALCLITPNDYIYGRKAVFIVHEDSELAKEAHYPEKWHDEISMTKFKNLPYSDIHREDSEQTYAVIDCGEKFEFHLWKSPRRISAVTERCKDFGDIWRGGVCVHSGNKFGDHEHFYVIGSVIWKKARP